MTCHALAPDTTFQLLSNAKFQLLYHTQTVRIKQLSNTLCKVTQRSRGDGPGNTVAELILSKFTPSCVANIVNLACPKGTAARCFTGCRGHRNVCTKQVDSGERCDCHRVCPVKKKCENQSTGRLRDNTKYNEQMLMHQAARGTRVISYQL